MTLDEDRRTTARMDAERELRNAVLRYVAATGGEISDWPIAPGRDYGTTRDAEPLAGIRAAKVLEYASARLTRNYVAQARRTGRSWDQVGEALGLESDPDGYGHSVAEQAFEYAAGEPLSYGSSPSYGFTCGSCSQFVSDHGPYDPHPLDRETGHSAGCEHQAAEMAAWQAQRDREDAEWEAGQ
jgi:hypothetical protein